MTEVNFNWLKEMSGVFKFGKGVLGRSAIAVGIFLIAVVVAAFRLSSDKAILWDLGLGSAMFCVWFFSVLWFSGKHPDIALLEDAEWSGYKRFEAAAKG